MGHYERKKKTYLNIIWKKKLIITYIKIDISFYTANCSIVHNIQLVSINLKFILFFLISNNLFQ